jgi:hypothetical protein
LDWPRQVSHACIQQLGNLVRVGTPKSVCYEVSALEKQFEPGTI